MKRKPFQGVAAIVRFNWPFYLVSFLMIALGAGCVLWLPGWFSILALIGTVAAAWWTFASLMASWWVYDVSDLHRYRWLACTGVMPGGKFVNAHSGFDEMSTALQEHLAGEWMILDHHDPECMSEPSIHRARALYPPLPGTLAAPFDHWPSERESIDAVFGLLAIHELRTHADRVKWFSQARRCLVPGGRVVLVEHVRDAANFLAFGPGFLHFHSVETWGKSWADGGFRLADTFHISPWLRAFILTPA